MKRIVNKTLILVLILSSVLTINAQTNGLEDVESKIIELTNMEIDALRTGDCQLFSDFIDDNATFYLDGKKASNKGMIIGFCNRVKRPFEKPSNVTTDVMPISISSAYVIRVMEFSKDEKMYKKEIVTKIWLKGENGWKISHLHSTIKEL